MNADGSNLVWIYSRSGSQNEFVAEGGRDGAAGFQQGFKMRLGDFLETQRGFAAVATVRVATRQPQGLGNPDAIFVLTKLHFGEWNNRNGSSITGLRSNIKRALLACHRALSSRFSDDIYPE